MAGVRRRARDRGAEPPDHARTDDAGAGAGDRHEDDAGQWIQMTTGTQSRELDADNDVYFK